MTPRDVSTTAGRGGRARGASKVTRESTATRATREAAARPQAVETEAPGTPQLSGTGRVILGMIAVGKRTGYDIKQLVDRSTRFFWAASYGQIYPELRRLEEQGLVTSRPEPSGSRARTVYDLTDAGEEALRQWLTAPEEPLYELRDEGLLKLFFSGAAGVHTALDQLEAIRVTHERKLATLRTIESGARSAPIEGPYLTLQFGMGMSQWTIDWCQAMAERLRESHLEREGGS